MIRQKEKDKKALILDAMRKLIIDGRAADCSVSEIAKTAGIGKGSIYYYYRSKREIELDLFYKTYGGFVEKCEQILKTEATALEKMKTLFVTYCCQSIDAAMDDYLHLPHNMDMHQMVLATLVNAISPVLAQMLEQGVSEGVFRQGIMAPEYAQIYSCVFAFLFDSGIFKLTEEEVMKKLTAFAQITEDSLGAQKGTFAFACDKNYLLSLPVAENRASPFLIV